MKISRRGFLELSGLALAGVLAKPVFNRVSQASPAQPAFAKLPAPVRWAMVVDLGTCTAGNGCQDCIAACHRVHNVPDFPDPKDKISWLRTVPAERIFSEQEHEFMPEGWQQKPAMILCNHCDNPPCVKVCPVQATWKRADGIVMIDYHRCIGCRYCMAACPYGSRSFNWRDPRPFIRELNLDSPTRTRGVVEKCNFCEERLAVGKLPACVETCPEKALIFGNVAAPDSAVSQLLRSRYSLTRKPALGTRPNVYYLV